VKFRAELQQDGKTATGITDPPEVLGGGRRPAVTVTINGHAFRTTVGSMKGVAKIPVSAAAGERFGRLPYGHQKEYVTWIEGAKKPETRGRRVSETHRRLAGEDSRG
jgi:Bacteriocin-protection, YdeI or OmpD-Associated/Domain of unknown function (DUF1905)